MDSLEALYADLRKLKLEEGDLRTQTQAIVDVYQRHGKIPIFSVKGYAGPTPEIVGQDYTLPGANYSDLDPATRKGVYFSDRVLPHYSTSDTIRGASDTRKPFAVYVYPADTPLWPATSTMKETTTGQAGEVDLTRKVAAIQQTQSEWLIDPGQELTGETVPARFVHLEVGRDWTTPEARRDILQGPSVKSPGDTPRWSEVRARLTYLQSELEGAEKYVSVGAAHSIGGVSGQFESEQLRPDQVEFNRTRYRAGTPGSRFYQYSREREELLAEAEEHLNQKLSRNVRRLRQHSRRAQKEIRERGGLSRELELLIQKEEPEFPVHPVRGYSGKYRRVKELGDRILRTAEVEQDIKLGILKPSERAHQLVKEIEDILDNLDSPLDYNSQVIQDFIQEQTSRNGTIPSSESELRTALQYRLGQTSTSQLRNQQSGVQILLSDTPENLRRRGSGILGIDKVRRNTGSYWRKDPSSGRRVKTPIGLLDVFAASRQSSSETRALVQRASHLQQTVAQRLQTHTQAESTVITKVVSELVESQEKQATQRALLLGESTHALPGLLSAPVKGNNLAGKGVKAVIASAFAGAASLMSRRGRRAAKTAAAAIEHGVDVARETSGGGLWI